MPELQAKLLIVDDDFLVRTSLSLIFAELGYETRLCADGALAEAEIWEEIPDILISDLEAIDISGLNLLTAVRRRFSSIRVIAMGGAFSGNCIPPGVAADAFYQKGAGPDRLIEIVDGMTRKGRSDSRLSMESLFGFPVFEAIPSWPGAERTAFPANRRIVLPILKMVHPTEEAPAIVIMAQEVRSQ